MNGAKERRRRSVEESNEDKQILKNTSKSTSNGEVGNETAFRSTSKGTQTIDDSRVCEGNRGGRGGTHERLLSG